MNLIYFLMSGGIEDWSTYLNNLSFMFFRFSPQLNVVERLLWFGHGQENLFKCRLIDGISTFHGFISILNERFWAKTHLMLSLKTDLIGMTCLSFSSCSNISAREVSRAAINLIEPLNRYPWTVRGLFNEKWIGPRIPALEFIFHSETRNHFHC